MNSTVFNSDFEISLRVLLVLMSSNRALSSDMIAAADFITVYGLDFGVSEKNLHGNNDYRYSEFTLRMEKIANAVKELTLKGLLKITITNHGFLFSLNTLGADTVAKLTSDYATEYRRIVKKALLHINGKTEQSVLREIIARPFHRGVNG